MKENERIIIIGSGIAGLTAAITLASNNVKSLLVSNQQSERAGSCMAEGGINAAIDPHNEGDCPEKHYMETCKSADELADKEAIKDLVEAAPELVKWLQKIGTQFTLTENDELEVRAFGGQSYKRTIFAGDSTGKQIMTALIDEARKYETQGLIKRLSHHSFAALKVKNSKIKGCFVKDIFTDEIISLNSRGIIIASGGYHGLFANTTGARADDGEVTARLLAQGINMSNLEFIQFHPTTISNGNKRLLITEAARGEGGRLCVIRNEEPYYFMEEKYPKFKNLMTRDVTTREIAMQKTQVYMDMRGINPSIFEKRLSGLMDECLTYTGIDPSKELLPIEPGIHYFMGGIWVDKNHATNIDGLYAAGECACSYHGANRLGGNSLLGAVYGGKKAAKSILAKKNQLVDTEKIDTEKREEWMDFSLMDLESSSEEKYEIARILNKTLGIVRNEQTMTQALEALHKYKSPFALLARASILSALHRKESRGAHYRSDFPEKDIKFQRASIVKNIGGKISIEICGFDKTTEK